MGSIGFSGQLVEVFKGMQFGIVLSEAVADTFWQHKTYPTATSKLPIEPRPGKPSPQPQTSTPGNLLTPRLHQDIRGANILVKKLGLELTEDGAALPDASC